MQSLNEWSYSVVTAMELFAGAQNKREIRIIEKLLNIYREIPLSRKIGNRGRDVIKHYAKSDGLDPLDAMIAATAIVEGLILSTRNRKQRHSRTEGRDAAVFLVRCRIRFDFISEINSFAFG